MVHGLHKGQSTKAQMHVNTSEMHMQAGDGVLGCYELNPPGFFAEHALIENVAYP